jgi:phosphonate utilization transcriptional regulator
VTGIVPRFDDTSMKTSNADSARVRGAPDRRALDNPLAPRRAATVPDVGPGASITLLQSHSLPGLVQRELERMILAGELVPGSKLNEVALAESLGVSRGPVREAFRALEESGLVRLEKNRGVYVRQIPIDEADDIYELRAVLDEFAGRRVAATISADALRELRAHVARMEKAAARHDVDTYLATNVRFHDHLVELAGNPKLLLTYRRLANELRLFRRATLAHADTLAVSAREHREIVDHIGAGKVAAAGRALYQHVMASRDRMHEAQRAQSRLPEPPARAAVATAPATNDRSRIRNRRANGFAPAVATPLKSSGGTA